MNSEILDNISDIDLSDHFANMSMSEEGPVNRQYQYIRQIGKGGFGTVYLAADPSDGIYKAIKEIQVNNMDPHKINEAEKEAALLEELDHPNILRCVDFFFTPAPAAVSLVLEYCEKGTMSSFLKQSGQLSTVLVHKWTNQLLSALQYLHSEGIIHRDLKPDNILITNNNDVKIADFGLSKIMDTVMPEEYDNYFFGNKEYAQTACGTKNYMAPEVWNKHYDDRSDVFSLGLILYVMLTQRKVSHANYLGVTLVPHEYIGITLGQDPTKMRKLFTESQWRKADYRALRDLVGAMLTVDYQQRPRSSELIYRPNNMVAKSGSTGSFRKLAVGSVALVAGLALGFMFTQTPDENNNNNEEHEDDDDEVEDEYDDQSDLEELSVYSDETDRNLSSVSSSCSDSLSEESDLEENDELDDDEEENDE